MQVTLINDDCRNALKHIRSSSVQSIITSPPYFGVRDYKASGQIGLNTDLDCLAWASKGKPCDDCYVCQMRQVFSEAWRSLREDGTLWLNLGDGHYNYRPGNYDDDRPHSFGKDRATTTRRGLPASTVTSKRGRKLTAVKEKDLMGVPWRVALALQADGWYLRSDIIWSKPNPQPESVRDRPTRSHEYLFLLTKSEKYYYDREKILEPTVSGSGYKNKKTVWTVNTTRQSTKHTATFPPQLILPCVLASCRPGDIVLDPFAGTGTTIDLATRHGCNAIAIEINKDYCEFMENRFSSFIYPRKPTQATTTGDTHENV